MPRFVFSRASIVDEIFTVDAEDLETAQQMVYDGAPGVKIQQGEWIDWYHDEYTLESEEDDLVSFIKSKERA
jgi:hypothetical protein